MLISFLLDIKAEIENVIKMGRKLVDSVEVADDNKKEALTTKIDCLKEEFNITGKNVSEVQSNLELSLSLMKKYEAASSALEAWMLSSLNQISSIDNNSSNIQQLSDMIRELYLDLPKFKRTYVELYKIHEEISAVSHSEKLVEGLGNQIKNLENQWKEMENKVKERFNKLSPDAALESSYPGEINVQLKAR